MNSTPNENKSSGKMEHSKEPWEFVKLPDPHFERRITNYIIGPDKFMKIAAVLQDEDAARIVACVNGAKDVPSTWFSVSSSSTPVKDLIDENNLLGEQLNSLRSQLSAAQKKAE